MGSRVPIGWELDIVKALRPCRKPSRNWLLRVTCMEHRDHTEGGDTWSNLRDLTEIKERKGKLKSQNLTEREHSGSIHISK